MIRIPPGASSRWRTRREFLTAALAMPALLRARPARAKDAPVTVRIAAAKAAALAPALMIQQFLPAGSKAQITLMDTPADMTTALLTDVVDVAYAGLTAGIAARARGEPISILANGAGKGTAIVVGADGAIKTTADLRGRRVGFSPLSIQDILLHEELEKVGVKPGDLQLVRLPPADMPSALKSGEIDAFAGVEPDATLALLGGYGRILAYPYDNPVGTIHYGVLSCDHAIETKAPVLQAWARAHAAATEKLAIDPDGWAALVAREWALDRGATRRSLDNISLAWRLDVAFIVQLSSLMDRMQALGAISTVPAANEVMARDFVDGVVL